MNTFKYISTALLSLGFVMPVVLSMPASAQTEELSPEQARHIIENTIVHQVPAKSKPQTTKHIEEKAQAKPYQSAPDTYQSTPDAYQSVTRHSQNTPDWGEFKPVQLEDLYSNEADLRRAQGLNQTYEKQVRQQPQTHLKRVQKPMSKRHVQTRTLNQENFNPFERVPVTKSEEHIESAQERFEDLSATDIPSVEDYDESVLRKIEAAKLEQGDINKELESMSTQAKAEVKQFKDQPQVITKKVPAIIPSTKSTMSHAAKNAADEYVPVNERELFPEKFTAQKNEAVKTARQLPAASNTSKSVQQTLAPTNDSAKTLPTEKLAIEKVSAIKPRAQKQVQLSEEELAEQLTNQGANLQAATMPADFSRAAPVREQLKAQKAAAKTGLDNSKKALQKKVKQSDEGLQRSLNNQYQPPTPSTYERHGIIENFEEYKEVDIDDSAVDAMRNDIMVNKEKGIIAGEEAQVLSIEDAKRAIQQQQR